MLLHNPRVNEGMGIGNDKDKCPVCAQPLTHPERIPGLNNQSHKLGVCIKCGAKSRVVNMELIFTGRFRR